MPVPPEIRAVERPKNTIVEDRGKDGPKRYAVRERSSVKYIPGKNPQPHNGKVIGHIINGKYVPLIHPGKPDITADAHADSNTETDSPAKPSGNGTAGSPDDFVY